MKFVLIFALLLSCDVFSDVQRFSLSSEKLGEGVTVQVSLPDTYQHSDDFSYPVLVVLDGSTQFNHAAASVHFYSTYAVIPEMIVVGVSTQNRLALFTPTEPEAVAGRSGRADLFTDFLQNKLITALNKRYRVAPYYVISGHSLSGLYTSYLAVSGKSTFNAAISISPSLWWDDSAIVDMYESNHKTKAGKPFRWFLSIASEPNEMAESFNAMLTALKEKPKKTLHYAYAHLPEETHDSTPLIGNAKGLRAIFSDWNAVPEISVKSLSELRKYYDEKAQQYGFAFPLSAHQYNVYGLKAAYEDKTAWGVEILEQGTKDFPASEILWDSLATAYKLGNKLQKALAASERAVHLGTANESIFISEIQAQNTQLKLANKQP